MKRKNWIFQLIFFLLAIILPYIFAWQFQGADHTFGGFLLNPIDGNSYLAKMMEGYQGSWQFHLPYSANPGDGSYLFLFYILLGHIASFFNISLVWMFHIARIGSALFLFWTLVRLVDRLPLSIETKPGLLWWLTLGSGMGWLAAGNPKILPVDFWVAETYPFLAAYANPHFPLALGLMLLLIDSDQSKQSWILDFFIAACLALILPFGAGIVLMVLGGDSLIRIIQKKSISWKKFAAVFFGCMPFLVYELWVINFQPALSVWNAQNVTPTPAVGLLFLAFLPALPLAVYAIIKKILLKDDIYQKYMIWTVGASVLLFIPVNLQRRFMLGLYIPITILAVVGIKEILKIKPRIIPGSVFLCVLLTVPSNLLVLASGFYGVISHAPSIYLTRGEVESFEWLKSNTPERSLILAGPDTGLFIPAYSGRRVLYGHPFETIQSETERLKVESYYLNADPGFRDEFTRTQNIDYVYSGPREEALNPKNILGMRVVYSKDGVSIYAVGENP